MPDDLSGLTGQFRSSLYAERASVTEEERDKILDSIMAELEKIEIEDMLEKAGVTEEERWKWTIKKIESEGETKFLMVYTGEYLRTIPRPMPMALARFKAPWWRRLGGWLWRRIFTHPSCCVYETAPREHTLPPRLTMGDDRDDG